MTNQENSIENSGVASNLQSKEEILALSQSFQKDEDDSRGKDLRDIRSKSHNSRQEELSEAIEDRQVLREQRSELKSEIATEKDVLRELRAYRKAINLEQKIETIESKLNGLEESGQTLSSRYQNLTTRLSKFKSKLSDIRILEENNSETLDRDALESRIQYGRNTLYDLRARMKQVRDEIKETSETIKKIRADKDDTNDDPNDVVQNTNPVAVDDSAALSEDGTVVIDLLGNDNDKDGDNLTITSLSSVAHGTLVNNGDGTVSYTPDANYNGSDSFSYSISDGNGGTNTASVSLAVASINDAPVLLVLSQTNIIENVAAGTAVGTLSASDVDADTLTYRLTGDADNKFEIVGNELRVKNALDFETDTNHGITIEVRDGNGGTMDLSFTITITNDTSDDIIIPGNAAPDANSDIVTLNEDDSVTVDLLANDSDADGDTITIVSISAAANGVIVNNGDGTATYTPNADYNGFDSFTYTISDGNGSTSSASVNLSINPVYDVPNVTITTFDIIESAPKRTLVGRIEVEGTSEYTYKIINGNDNNVFAVDKDGFLSLTRDAPQHLDFDNKSQYDLKIEISDGTNKFTENATINILDSAIDPNNTAPNAVKDIYYIDEDSGSHILNILANDTDIDGDTISLHSVELTSVSKGSVTVNPDNTITYTPNTNVSGEERFEYSVIDENGAIREGNRIIIHIDPVNDAPVVTNSDFNFFQSKPITVGGLTEASDVENSQLSITNISIPSQGSVIQNSDGTLTYTPNSNFTGSDSFTYTVSDENGGNTVATATFTKVDTMVAADDQYEVVGARVTTLDVTSNDSFDLDLHSIRVKDMPAQGNVTVNPDGTLALVLTDPDFSGLLSFTYEIEDQSGNISEGNVSLNVEQSIQQAGWGYGDHYMLQTNSNGNVIVEAGENHRKIFVTEGDHGLSRQDIAGLEGVDVSQVNSRWILENGLPYGSTEATALKTDVGIEVWQHTTGGGKSNSNWLLFERGYEYRSVDTNRIFDRGTNGESELNPAHVTSYGVGELPIIYDSAALQTLPSKNIVISNLRLGGGLKVYGIEGSHEDKNVLVDNSILAGEMNIRYFDNFTFINSSVVDSTNFAPRSGAASWDAFRDRINGFLAKDVDGILVDNSYFDHNGWGAGFDPNLSADSPQAPGVYSHNVYFQYDTTDVTYRNSISTRSSYVGVQFRGGAFVEDNLFFNNMWNFSILGGDYKTFGPVGNYSLVSGNVTTSSATHLLSVRPTLAAWGVQDLAWLTTHVDNIVAHAANPADAQEIIEKYLVKSPLYIEDEANYNDTIIYKWYGQRDIERYTSEQLETFANNVENLDKTVLDQTTIENYAANLLGDPNATVDDLANYLRDNASSNLDGYTDAELIIKYFQEGFGVDIPESVLESETLRFVPSDLGEGVRWDNRLNWDKGYLPEDGDNINLAGNWVNFSGTVTVNDLDLGSNGELTVRQGYLNVANDLQVGEDGGRLLIGNAGQFWADGYSDADMLSITADGGRFANTGDWDGSYSLDISGNAQVIFAAGYNATFTVDSGDSIMIAGSNAKVGFDGSDAGDASLILKGGGTLAFDIDGDDITTIREFKSGHFGDTPDINSIIDLGSGDTTLALDVSDIALADGLYSYDLIKEIDQLYGDFGDIDITGMDSNVTGLRVSVDRETDEMRLELSVNDGSLKGVEVDLYASAEVDTFFINDNTDIIESIHNFDAASGDVLDISGILEGYDPLSDAITDFVQITDDGSDTSIMIDVDGGANNFVEMLRLDGVIGLADAATLFSDGTIETMV
ncbi:MAG: tandem-95 repeat protein [Bdellovibrionales bacterium]